MGGASRDSAGAGMSGGRAGFSARQVTVLAGVQMLPSPRTTRFDKPLRMQNRLYEASSCEADATAGCVSSLGHTRLKLEDHWLRAKLGEEKLWYGSAAGKPGVILGTWASQRQQEVRASVPQGALRQLGAPVQASPAARTRRPEAVPRSQLQQRQFLQEEAPVEPKEQPPCADTCRDKYQLGA